MLDANENFLPIVFYTIVQSPHNLAMQFIMQVGYNMLTTN